VYVFDTSALIGAWVRMYPPDIIPALWDRIDELGAAGQLTVPEEVLRELEAQEDDLHAWVKSRADFLVSPTDRAVLLEARAVLQDHPELTKTGTGRGLADPFVIAMAHVKAFTVVTEERGGSAAKPRIPYVCQQRQVRCMSVLEVIRQQSWTFRN
jgi:hypothetical protein